MSKEQTKTASAVEEDDHAAVARRVGICISLWYFTELDQWKLSLSNNCYGQPILAIGPLRLRWSPIWIWR